MRLRENDVEYIGFWPRFLAKFIDGVIYAIFIAIPFVIPLVELLFLVFNQATPGKMVISAKIVDEKTGKAPTFMQCLIRYVTFALLSCITFGLFVFSICFDDKKRGWHDKLAGTVVIRKKNGGSVEYPIDDAIQRARESDNDNGVEQFFRVYSFTDPSRAYEIWVELPTESKAVIARANPEAADVMKQADQQLREIEEERIRGDDDDSDSDDDENED